MAAGDPSPPTRSSRRRPQQTTGLVAPDGIVGVAAELPGRAGRCRRRACTPRRSSTTTSPASPRTGRRRSAPASTITFIPSPTRQPTCRAGQLGRRARYTSRIGDTTTSDASSRSPAPGLTTAATDTLTGCTGPAGAPPTRSPRTAASARPGRPPCPPPRSAQTGEGQCRPSAKNSQAVQEQRGPDRPAGRLHDRRDQLLLRRAGQRRRDQRGQQRGAQLQRHQQPVVHDQPVQPQRLRRPGHADATEMRFVGSAGTIITNPDGSYGLFLSGAWAADGDSDAFNQIFYPPRPTASTGPIPTVGDQHRLHLRRLGRPGRRRRAADRLGICAYYSGRAYGPAVVPEPADGTLTMVFAGYRLPKPIATAGHGPRHQRPAHYTVGANDPPSTATSSRSPSIPSPTAATPPRRRWRSSCPWPRWS